MTRYRLIFFLSIFCLSFMRYVYAEKYAGEFLELGVGGKALGMGSAFVSLADDGSAPYWNPAGLAQIRHFSVTLMHASIFSGLANHDFLSYVQPISKEANLSISWIRLGIDDIPRFGELVGTAEDRQRDPQLRPSGEPLGYFEDRENAVFLSFARAFYTEFKNKPFGFSVGANFKYLAQKLDNHWGTGIGFDLGGLLKFSGAEVFGGKDLGDFSFALKLSDLGRTNILWNTPSEHGDAIPMHLILGGSYTQSLPLIKSQIIFSADKETHYEQKYHFGLEYSFRNCVFLRGGANYKSPTAGVGLKIWHFKIDYAFCSYELGNTHRLSGEVRF
ncbi:MAG: UPF0164 family protein [Candidatus Edwardsbacteria bacterium]